MGPPTGHPAASPLVTKWSSKPADHKIVRVRNNQRRHRERVKLHIADLESKLEETRVELQKALSRIECLTTELAIAKTSRPVSCAGPAAPDCPATTNSEDHNVSRQPSFSSQSLAASEPEGEDRLVSFQIGQSMAVRLNDRLISLQGDPLLASATSADTWSAYDAAAGDEEKLRCKLWPPDPEESTTRCRDAYTIIAEQNYASLDASALREWLEPGFRGAYTKGGGCRVENKLLFELLDHISSL